MAGKGDNSKKTMIDALNKTLADHFALYMKTKSFHWHLKGPRFRDLHLLFDEQATAIYGITDAMAERVRKQDGDTLTSIGAIARLTSIKDQDLTDLTTDKMIKELHTDNSKLVEDFKDLKDKAEAAGDNATSALVDEWQDEAERRVWFLSQEMR
ncbi:DNA starvation/stationary phase protection protein [Altererythrobacter salegens]|uniref:DNA starvation/stationary phase protection protein n=1 Tax=Croceibacterium salegens TaxID=1737568 RepID=A0A6I4SVY0_9SPHN|nr:DNA starvation/stationary phase protection protein [Croceibacterium salegens]MXO60141.1 DNA starvation/stationary phase protection protein [Croceibacterium salegens]